MRRPHRNIEIFSMSVLDMFASALGAFIMCSIILFPYYNKDVTKELTAAKSELEKTKTQLAGEQKKAANAEETIKGQQPAVESARKAQGTLKQCRLGLNMCQAELAKGFLMVQIEWQAPVDVNLKVTDPRGNEFSWAKTNRTGRDFPNSKAHLSIDILAGPGIEVWVDPEAAPGKYLVEYETPRDPGGGIPVAGYVFDRYGKKDLQPRTLRGGALRVQAATIQIGDDGSVTVR